jgi:hypothetical protein
LVPASQDHWTIHFVESGFVSCARKRKGSRSGEDAMSTLAVVEAILRNAAVPLSVREIVERAGDTLPTKSKTPDTVVARDLSMDIKKKGEASSFTRTSPGRYAMRDQVTRQPTESPTAAVYPPATRVPGNGQVESDGVTPVVGQNLERAGTRPATKPPTSSSSEEMSA